MKSSILSVFFSIIILVGAAISPFDSPDYCSQIITPTCNTTFSYIDTINAEIRPTLSNLVQTSFFKYFKLDLDKQCKFWNAQHFCATKNCAVETLPEDQYNWADVQDEFRPSKLGEIQHKTASSETSQTCEDLDYSQIDEGHDCVFVDLLANPERFTGYGGAQSFEVWKAIYSENCFPNTSPMSMAVGSEPENCVEKNLFYRLVSGMHASIAVHLSNEYLDPATETFGPNLKVFMERVGKFNDRLANIYFNYALVSQAIVKLGDLVAIGDYIKGDTVSKEQNDFLGNDSTSLPQYSEMVDKITNVLSNEPLFESHSLFDPATVGPELKNEFRSRFRNVSAIMDCVGCDRCRMWGKLQTIGYGTALKVLFESEDPQTQHLLKFRRIELVALFNTFDRLSKSVASINNFKSMYLEHLEEVAAGRVQHGDFEPLHDKGIEFPFVAWKPKPVSVSKPSDVEGGNLSGDAEKRSVDEGKISAPKQKKQNFAQEFEDVMAAVRFVLESYKNFPKTMYEIAMYYISGWWNVYIGKAVYVPESKVDTTISDEL
ncbi:hypothetical protein JCM33374_g81 [Metschnikowia sp. JCM 33374]|nr:hypothetical protein JCM33374_g81 [Metschnikowia sp. JCM 33374]